jgi:sugar phosphate isomerase/epimerase
VVAYGGQTVQMDPIFPAFGLDIQPANINRLRTLLLERGLEIVVKGNSGGAGFLAVEEVEAGRVVAAMREKFAAAAALGAHVVRLVSRAYPFPTGKWTPPSIPRGDLLERLVKTLSRLLSEAREWGLVLALENHGDLYVSEIKWILSELNSAALRVQLDVAEQTVLFEDALQAVQELSPYAVTVHWTNFVPRLTDEGYLVTSCRPHEGLLPLAKMAEVLRSLPQDLLVFVAGQALCQADEDTIVKEHLAFLSQELLGETFAVAGRS